MKQLAKYLLPLCCGIALASCYGLDKEEYRELAPITVSGLDRTLTKIREYQFPLSRF